MGSVEVKFFSFFCTELGYGHQPSTNINHEIWISHASFIQLTQDLLSSETIKVFCFLLGLAKCDLNSLFQFLN